MNCDMKRSISLYSYQDEYYDGKLFNHLLSQ